MQDFLQDLKVVWLNKTDMVKNNHLAYQMVPPEKPDIIYLLNTVAANIYSCGKFAVRLVNMQGAAANAKVPQKTISQILIAAFNKLEIQNVCIRVENEESIIELIRNQKMINIPSQVLRTQSTNHPFGEFATGNSFQSIMLFSNIKSLFMTFAMPQYPTWFFPVLFKGFDLIIDQRHVVPAPYEALTQIVNGAMFDCFIDYDVVSAPSDLYHSLTFENIHINDRNNQYYGQEGIEWQNTDNLFLATTLYNGTKSNKTMYLNKFMLAWKLAKDDSFMRGYNSSKIGARTNTQVILHGSIQQRIIETIHSDDKQNQNDFTQFCIMRSYPNPLQVNLTLLKHYLCEAVVRIIFVDAPDPQVLSMEVIGELGGSVVRNG